MNIITFLTTALLTPADKTTPSAVLSADLNTDYGKIMKSSSFT